jgi:predicted nucleic acid-binding Zn ribbon protein
MTEDIGDILARRLRSRGLDKAALGAWVCSVADKVAAGEFKSVSFKDGVLKIRVSSGARAALLKMKEQEYLSKINTELKRELVKKLRFEIL